MLLTVLGSSGAFPTATAPASGYLVSHGETSLWMECGPGTLMAVQGVTGLERISAMVVSHRHPDHCSDLLAFATWLRYGPNPPRSVDVHCPPDTAARVSAFGGTSVASAFRFHTDGEPAEVGDIQLSFGLANHNVPALVTRLTAGGRVLTYSGDTGMGGDLEAMAHEADTLLCEATYPAESVDPWPYHLRSVEAARVATRAGARRLLLTHLAPNLDPARSISEARREFAGPIDWAGPGTTFEI